MTPPAVGADAECAIHGEQEPRAPSPRRRADRRRRGEWRHRRRQPVAVAPCRGPQALSRAHHRPRGNHGAQDVGIAAARFARSGRTSSSRGSATMPPPDAEIAGSFAAALALVRLPEPVFCIGGGELYRYRPALRDDAAPHRDRARFRRRCPVSPPSSAATGAKRRVKITRRAIRTASPMPMSPTSASRPSCDRVLSSSTSTKEPSACQQAASMASSSRDCATRARPPKASMHPPVGAARSSLSDASRVRRRAGCVPATRSSNSSREETPSAALSTSPTMARCNPDRSSSIALFASICQCGVARQPRDHFAQPGQFELRRQLEIDLGDSSTGRRVAPATSTMSSVEVQRVERHRAQPPAPRARPSRRSPPPPRRPARARRVEQRRQARRQRFDARGEVGNGRGHVFAEPPRPQEPRRTALELAAHVDQHRGCSASSTWLSSASIGLPQRDEAEDLAAQQIGADDLVRPARPWIPAAGGRTCCRRDSACCWSHASR